MFNKYIRDHVRVPILNFGRGGEHQKNLLNSLQGHHISAWPSVSLLSHFFSVPVFPLSRHIVFIPPSPSQPPAASLFYISLSITLSFCICIFTAFPSFLGAPVLSSSCYPWKKENNHMMMTSALPFNPKTFRRLKNQGWRVFSCANTVSRMSIVTSQQRLLSAPAGTENTTWPGCCCPLNYLCKCQQTD